MSSLTDIINTNESITQGSIYVSKKKNTLGTFNTLEGNDNKRSYKSVETFLSESLNTDGDGVQVGDSSDETYSDLSLNELYVIYKDKVALLDTALSSLSGSSTLYTNYGVYSDGGSNKYFYATDDGSTYTYKDIYQGSSTDSTLTSAAGSDSLTDDTLFPDSIGLTCGQMTETTSFPGGTDPSGTTDDEFQAPLDAVCNPYSDDSDENFKDAIILITQLNEIVSEMKSKVSGGTDDTLNIDDLDKTLKEYQARYNFMLKYKTSSAVAASNSDDITNNPGSLDEQSSGYLETESLKYDSARLIYVSLLLGSVIAGAVTVSAIVNTNTNQ